MTQRTLTLGRKPPQHWAGIYRIWDPPLAPHILRRMLTDQSKCGREIPEWKRLKTLSYEKPWGSVGDKNDFRETQ